MEAHQRIWVCAILHVRHYLQQHGGGAKIGQAPAARRAWINEALFFMLQRCFLNELGFSSEQCLILFRRNQRYQSACMYATFSWHIPQPEQVAAQEVAAETNELIHLEAEEPISEPQQPIGAVEIDDMEGQNGEDQIDKPEKLASGDEPKPAEDTKSAE
jgi:hypothetical protein